MKFDRIRVFKTLNLLMLATAIVLGAYWAAEAKKYVDKDVFTIAPGRNLGLFDFSKAQIEELESGEFLGLISYESLGETMVQFDEIKAHVQVIYTNSDYFSLTRIPFVQGGPWIEEKERVIVLSESLAWSLFGNIRVTGETVIVSDETYTVVGVAKQKKLSRDACFAWLPVWTAGADPAFSRIYLKPHSYNPLDSYKEIQNLLAGLNESELIYRITDMNQYVESIGWRYQLLGSLAGIYGIGALLRHSWRFGRWTLVRNRKWISLLWLIVLNILFMIVAAGNLGVDIWFLAFPGDRWEQIFRALTNSGVFAHQYLSYSLMELSRINTLANIAFGAGLIGLFNYIVFGRGLTGLFNFVILHPWKGGGPMQ